MALWIHNVTPDDKFDGEMHSYQVKLNRTVLVGFEHRRACGAAECFRAAAAALDAAGHVGPHDVDD